MNTLSASFSRTSKVFDSLDKLQVTDQINWEIYPYSKVVEDLSLYWDKEDWERALSGEMDDQTSFLASSMVRKSARGGSLLNETSQALHREKAAEKLENLRSFQADYVPVCEIFVPENLCEAAASWVPDILCVLLPCWLPDIGFHLAS